MKRCAWPKPTCHEPATDRNPGSMLVYCPDHARAARVRRSEILGDASPPVPNPNKGRT